MPSNVLSKTLVFDSYHIKTNTHPNPSVQPFKS